jgi:hypothetical protein
MVSKWVLARYTSSGETRNVVVYYIEINNTLSDVTRGSTKPDAYLVPAISARPTLGRGSRRTR